MNAAGRASRRLGHDYVGTEHLLLALADDRGTPSARALAARGLSADEVRAEVGRLVSTYETPGRRLDADALATLGIDLDEVRRRVDQAFGPDALDRTRAGCTPVTPWLKQALELATQEAEGSCLLPEHALIGLASVADCPAAEILASHGITRQVLRDAFGRERPDPKA